MEDLVRWLGQQLDTDERTARAATPGPWEQSGIGEYGWGVSFSRPGAGVEVEDSDQGRADADFIAEHDPARVLREIEAKRQIIARYEFVCQEAVRLAQNGQEHESWVQAGGALQSVVLCLAAVYVDRDGYKESWRA
ncbi:DUF6221 family protein [Streptomyces ossamyceticus]|uniref:DUF6221 family protein n=1 Tax=Streptomyces ossamyceticus TaxID=249581 RepID=UPI0006E3A4EF|nr:DUF6221 family protein [Streptomyces ossamyceticus]